jgi:hypothetical protein
MEKTGHMTTWWVHLGHLCTPTICYIMRLIEGQIFFARIILESNKQHVEDQTKLDRTMENG